MARTRPTRAFFYFYTIDKIVVNHCQSAALHTGTPTTDDTNQPPNLRPCTICWPTAIAEQLHAHSDTARFIAKLHQTANVDNQLTDAIKLGLVAVEALPAGSDKPWLCWRSLNRLRTGISRAKTTMRRWGYIRLIDHNHIIIVVDVNFHLDVDSNIDAHKFNDSLATCGLVKHVNDPTHQKGHTLDVLTTKDSNDIITAGCSHC